ncbi:MAG: hypothetical protein H6Q57_2054 [Geobacteraceae bacterium]|nr:hypothetical protein [Geobacteraceae bacterium]
MARIIFTLFFSLFAFPCLLAHGSQQARPFAGTGLLVIRSFSPHTSAGNDQVIIYEVPGIQRVAELKANDLRRFPGLPEICPDCQAVPVMGKKGNWLKIPYDDADREGWIQPRRYWEYIPWDDFLTGRNAVFLPKLRDRNYLVRKEPCDNSSALTSLPPTREFRIAGVEGDWACVQVEKAGKGWIRWRGEDGRLMISVRGIFP